MALIDDLEQINDVLTFADRIVNLERKGIITSTMLIEMKKKVLEYLETKFPPPPPP